MWFALFVFMPRLKVRFDEPEHAWIGLFIFEDDTQIVHSDVSRIYDSFAQLVAALGAMLDAHDERSVVWLEGPAELELHFSRRDDVLRLEINSFDDKKRPLEKPNAGFSFTGSYDEICLPFWRALRSLEGRYPEEELASRWKGYFPHRELARLTQMLGRA